MPLHSQYPNPEVLVEFIYQFQFEAWPIWASLHFFSGCSNVRYCLLISNIVQVNYVFETSFPFEPWGVFFFSLGIQRCLPGLLTNWSFTWNSMRLSIQCHTVVPGMADEEYLWLFQRLSLWPNFCLFPFPAIQTFCVCLLDWTQYVTIFLLFVL